MQFRSCFHQWKHVHCRLSKATVHVIATSECTHGGVLWFANHLETICVLVILSSGQIQALCRYTWTPSENLQCGWELFMIGLNVVSLSKKQCVWSGKIFSDKVIFCLFRQSNFPSVIRASDLVRKNTESSGTQAIFNSFCGILQWHEEQIMCFKFMHFFAVSFSLLNVITSYRPCLPSILGNIAIWTQKPPPGDYNTSHYVSYSLQNFKGIPGVLLATFSLCLNLICCKIWQSWIERVLNWMEGRSGDLSLNILRKLLY